MRLLVSRVNSEETQQKVTESLKSLGVAESEPKSTTAVHVAEQEVST